MMGPTYHIGHPHGDLCITRPGLNIEIACGHPSIAAGAQLQSWDSDIITRYCNICKKFIRQDQEEM